MTITTSAYVAVPARAAELGSIIPAGLVFLPANFESAIPGEDFRFRGEASTVTKLLAVAGIPVNRLSTGQQRPAFIHNHSHDWTLPIIFVGTELLKQSPDILSAALGVIQDYVIDLFKGVTDARTITAEVVIEDRRAQQYKRLTYEGSPEGLRELTGAIKALSRKI